MPLDHSSTGIAVMILVIGLTVFIGLVAFHVRTIFRSPFPGVRAIEALAISVPLFVLLFASSYVVMAAMSASNFGGRLTHTDGLYFTVTVLSTVGFGDITAKTQAARLGAQAGGGVQNRQSVASAPGLAAEFSAFYFRIRLSTSGC